MKEFSIPQQQITDNTKNVLIRGFFRICLDNKLYKEVENLLQVCNVKYETKE